MEQEPGEDPERQDPEHDGRPDPDGGRDDDGSEDDGSDFGSWEELEGTLAAAKALGEVLSGFEPGGTWDRHPPGPELAAALAAAAGRGGRWGVATGQQLIGLLRGMAAQQSWVSAGLLEMLRTLIRDDALSNPGGPRHGDLPDEWDEGLTREVALALAVSAQSADKMMRAAWELGARLPDVDRLLKDGTLDLPRARMIAEVFQDLSDIDAAKAEALLLPHLTEEPRKTYTQIERLATAIAVTVDPDLAERQRQAALKHRSRVTMFREQLGTASLSGRDLPVEEALAAYSNLSARAEQYKQSGVFPDESMDRLRATAYLDLLNRVSAEDRIAYGRLPADAPATSPDDTAATSSGDTAAAGPGAAGGTSPCPCHECDGSCAPPDDALSDESDDDDPEEDEPGGGFPDDEPGGSGQPGGGPGRGSGPRGAGNGGSGSSGGDERVGDPDAAAPPPQPSPPQPSLPRAPLPEPDSGPPPKLTDLIFPLVTLLGHAERPGEGHGLGTLDPALCRALAATAARSPWTTICVTITNHDGIAIGHGCAKPHRQPRKHSWFARPPGGPPPPLVSLPARINLTITAGRLAELRAQQRGGPPDPLGWALAQPDIPAGRPTRGRAGARGGGRAAGNALARLPARPPGDADWCGPWTLTVPTGQVYDVTIGPVPTYECDHRNESHAYKPNDTLRHLVQVRDHTCTFPTCNRHARESDFEHGAP